MFNKVELYNGQNWKYEKCFFSKSFKMYLLNVNMNQLYHLYEENPIELKTFL